ncbi:carbohydrate kinase family protein [Bacillus horti]|uniref:Pseudouridine kinase n=1 Tax=Caldalkalibacillus horti TaxID=77523 RepID=A0ABT9W4F9_9BACI|nr:PfkB family carbohydrate kinase [Bacillus horti]MDQ0168132.1 pseudouridine kinase [Bacillus horti]
MSSYDVVVIGTIFVDIKGFPQLSYDPRGRNIGNVHFYHGGVGRNIVETMAQLEVKTAFASTVDSSALGQEVMERLKAKDIETSFVQEVEQGMGMWLAILNEQGDLAGSISQMPSHDNMEEAILSKVDEFVAASSAVALEIDLTERIAEAVVEKALQMERPIYALPGNLAVILKRKDLFQHVQCFICNDVEATKITGISLGSDIQVRAAAEALLALGMKQVVVTLGEKGCFYADATTKDQGFVAPIPTDVVDTTGAGDSFFAGTVAALSKGQSLEDAVLQGTRVAAATISSTESTCQNLQEKLQEY